MRESPPIADWGPSAHLVSQIPRKVLRQTHPSPSRGTAGARGGLAGLPLPACTFPLLTFLGCHGCGDFPGEGSGWRSGRVVVSGCGRCGGGRSGSELVLVETDGGETEAV